jgi:hypothetical protein
MNETRHLSVEDLDLFALQILPEEEMAAALEHLRECEPCREQLAQIQGELVAYAMSAELQAPPERARERLITAVSQEKKPVPIDRVQAQPVEEPILLPTPISPLQPEAHAEPAPRRRGALAIAWTGWAVAAGLAVVAGLQYQQRQAVQSTLASADARLQETSAASAQASADAARAKEVLQTLTDAHAMQVALHLPATPGATPKPEAHAAYVADRGALVLVASNLQPVKPGKTYELWLLPAAAGGAPIPAGLFKPDAAGNDGGTQVPTPPIVLAGT